MRHIKTAGKRSGFQVLFSTRSAQAASMTLRSGEVSGEFGDEHPWAEQWLYVVSGSGRARVEKRRVPLEEGSLLLIAKGEKHQIENTGRKPLVTMSFYTPTAYTQEGELKRKRVG
ncbi:MAG: cupin domain-containing protein [Gemmataceae bacterium]